MSYGYGSSNPVGDEIADIREQNSRWRQDEIERLVREREAARYRQEHAELVAEFRLQYQALERLLYPFGSAASNQTLEPEHKASLSDVYQKSRQFIQVVQNLSEVEDNETLDNLVELIKAANNFVSLSLGKPLSKTEKSDSVLDIQTAKSRFEDSAIRLSRKLAPGICGKFMGAVLLFVGSILAVVTLGCITCVYKAGFELFSGYKSKQVESFKDSIVKGQDAFHALGKVQLAK
jgi:hypothetical protein